MKHKLRAMVLLCAVFSGFSQSDGLTEQELAMIKDALKRLFAISLSLEVPPGSEADKNQRRVVFASDYLVGKDKEITINIAKESVDSLKDLLRLWVKS